MLLRLIGRRFHKALERRLPANGLDAQSQRGDLMPQGCPQAVRHTQIPGESLDRALVAGGALKEQAQRAGKCLLDDLARHSGPIGRHEFVLIREDSAVALVVGEHGDGLARRIVDAEDNELAVNEPVRVASHRGRIFTVRPEAPVDIDGPFASPAVDVSGLEMGVRFDDDAHNLVDDLLPVALDHVQLLGKVDARGALRSRQIRTGVRVRRGQPDAVRGNAGLLRRAVDRSFEGLDAERVQVDHGELVCAVGHDQGGRHHARGVVAGGADVGLRSPVQLSNADRRRDVRPRDSGQQPRGRRVLRSLLDDVGRQGRDAQSQGRQNRRRAAKSCS